MESSRVASAIACCLALALVVSITACGSGEMPESETTRAIREKVRADMERDRLARIGQELAAVNEALANHPHAYGVNIAAEAEPAEGGEDSGGGIDLAKGEALYGANCASCHGARGEGDGPLAASLQPQPVKHSDGGYMNALSDDYLFKVVAQGGAAVGKSPMMAPWSPALSDSEIRSTVAFMRTLADPPYSDGSGSGGSGEEGSASDGAS